MSLTFTAEILPGDLGRDAHDVGVDECIVGALVSQAMEKNRRDIDDREHGHNRGADHNAVPVKKGRRFSRQRLIVKINQSVGFGGGSGWRARLPANGFVFENRHILLSLGLVAQTRGAEVDDAFQDPFAIRQATTPAGGEFQNPGVRDRMEKRAVG